MHLRFTLVGIAAMLLVSCGGGGGGSSTTPLTAAVPTATAAFSVPTPAPTAVPTAIPSAAASVAGSANTAFTCPSSDSALVAVTGGNAVEQRAGRLPRRAGRGGGGTLIAVSYDRAAASRSAQSIAAREASLGANVAGSFDFQHLGLVTHLLSVDASRVAAVESALRATAGVESVGLTGERRFPTTVSQPYFPNDPYFNGFQTTATVGRTTPSATYHVAPYDEGASVPGQWDMHAMQLEYAFGYSQSGNGSGITNAAALGSSSIKLAVIDTGEDTTHPELSGKIVYQHCFVTNTTGQQSSSSFTTDPDGHGTNVAGIAAAATGNNFGFTGAGGNTSIYAYRVFPTPDSNCSSPTSTDPQCGTDTVDIASAIEDAIAHGANVINLSLGGGSCVNGADSDPVEGQAIGDAIAANAIVVAAAGNDGSQGVDAPACDPFVIAVGASALADGQLNGANNSTGSAASPIEYVASYSDYGSPGRALRSAGAWGIVAPGGDPSGDNDADNLHWIENIWTSTPFASSDAGQCTDDYPSSATRAPLDCRDLIAGTSMASPHVAGVAALILAVNSSFQSPTKMKTLLCTTADDIGDPHEGCGRINAYRALATALGDTKLP